MTSEWIICNFRFFPFTFPLRLVDSRFLGSFANNVIDDAQPHDEADDAQPIWDLQLWFN